ncbi:hypothetical protein [Streptomyces kanamyceticus]|uniref:hypothetical protein n=1 Tax=Streptomyces kanamyceticus TaxID=1967 RepID=UPI0037DCC684
MPHTVTGRFDGGSTYEVQITGDAHRPVIGAIRAAALVKLHAGQPISLTPTDPLRVAFGDDVGAVLAVLRHCTSVLAHSVRP